MIEIILMATIGVFAGCLTGLIPGLHPNSIGAMILSVTPLLLLTFSTHAVIVFIISMAISHSFISFIPSIFLGMPEGETALSILPGHQLLINGRGYEAVYITVIGGIGVIILSALLLPFLILILPILYANVKMYIVLIMILILGLMLFTERGKRKIIGLLVFSFSGILGIFTFSGTFSSQSILFPVFTGLFGISTLLISYLSGVKIPEQNINDIVISNKKNITGIMKGFFSGVFVGIMPGIGASQASIVVHQITRSKSTREFLVSLGGINTVAALFSLMALYLINKPRSGVAVVIERIIGTMGFTELILLISTTLFATGISALITIKITKTFVKIIQKINYKKMMFSIILFLIIMTFVLTGFYGLLVLVTSTGIGLIPPLTGVKRTHCMGVLMLPIILFYLGIIL